MKRLVAMVSDSQDQRHTQREFIDYAMTFKVNEEPVDNRRLISVVREERK